MKIFLDADTELLINLSVLCGEGVCLLKRSSNLKKTGLILPKPENTDEIFVNTYNDCSELAEFLGNFHLITCKPRHLFVDLNLAKKKEVYHVISLLASLLQVAEIKVYCIFNSHGNHYDLWNTYGRVFDSVYVVCNKIVNLIQCETGKLSVCPVGDVNENLYKLI